MNFERLKYDPLSKSMINRVLEMDRDCGFGPKGTEPNRNRFYIVLVQKKSDVQVRTIAVKSKKRYMEPMIKEVGLASADDSCMLFRDLGYAGMGGYIVDWTYEFGQPRDPSGGWHGAL